MMGSPQVANFSPEPAWHYPAGNPEGIEMIDLAPSVQRTRGNASVRNKRAHHKVVDNTGNSFFQLSDLVPEYLITSSKQIGTRVHHVRPGEHAALESQIDRSEVFAEIEEVKSDCASDGWDTPTSKAISKGVIDLASEIVGLFPSVSPNPDVIPEKDGALAFEWNSPRGYFILSINLNGILYYISKIGERKARGSQDHIPNETQALMGLFLNRLYPSD